MKKAILYTILATALLTLSNAHATPDEITKLLSLGNFNIVGEKPGAGDCVVEFRSSQSDRVFSARHLDKNGNVVASLKFDDQTDTTNVGGKSKIEEDANGVVKGFRMFTATADGLSQGLRLEEWVTGPTYIANVNERSSVVFCIGEKVIVP